MRHYAASALDYIIFGKLFEWTYHRPIYFHLNSVHDIPWDNRFRLFEKLTEAQKTERRRLLAQVAVTGNYARFSGQIIPYPVYRDYYGQAMIPETLGFIDYPFFTDHPRRKVNHPDDLLQIAKRLKVIRGAFASFFWHPLLLQNDLLYYRKHPENLKTEGGKNTLIKMIDGLQELGYVFRSIEDRSLFP